MSSSSLLPPFQPLRFPHEPPKFSQNDMERFLEWCVKQDASDITLQSETEAFIEVHGKMHRCTLRPISHTELMDWAALLYGGEKVKATLSGNEDVDFSYELRPTRHERHRFRVNAVPIQIHGSRGIQITLRSIVAKPPTLASMNLPPAILQNLAPKQGMILITGGTGSGKSTLLASIIRHLAENPDGHLKVLTYESPIEFVYDEIEATTVSIAQTEIPTHLNSFALGVRNALRRKPAIILIGEARDAETIGEAVTAAMTGHLLYSTVHSNGFAETIRRMVNVFPEEERRAKMVDILSALRMIVSQRLVPSTDGKRVALREYVVFNDGIVDRLLSSPLDLISQVSRQILHEEGHSFVQDAAIHFAAGRISERTFKEIQLSTGVDVSMAPSSLEVAV